MAAGYLKNGLKGKKILVTGGSGFLGRYLVPELAKLCKEIAVYEDDIMSIGRFGKKFDIVCHLAGLTKIAEGVTANRLFNVNVNGTLEVMRYCHKKGARCVFASSSAARLGSFYGMSKMLAEDVCRHYSENFGVPVIALRIFNIYGPGQKMPFLVPHILSRLSGNKPLRLNTPGEVRDFVYVTDVVSAFILSCAHRGKGFETFNVGTGRGTSVRDLAGFISSAAGKKAKICADKYSGETDYVVADTRKISSVLNWHPAVSLERGLRSVIENHRNL